MDLTLTEEEVRVLRRFLSKYPTHGAVATTAMYVSPAQQLRNQADEIEQDEHDWPIIQEIRRKIKGYY